MFKNFEFETSVSGTTNMKTSKAKKVLVKLKTQYPRLEEEKVFDEMFGNVKKNPLKVVQVHGHIQFLLVDGSTAAFYNHRDGPFMPALRTLYKYPGMMPQVQVDKGAIRHILRGSDVMCPGLTSAGGKMPEEPLEEGTPVAIYAEGKTHPLAVGVLKMSTENIKTLNKGIAIGDVHHLDDGLWKNPEYD